MDHEIVVLEEELRKAMLNNDIKKLDELIDDSLVFVSPDGTLADKKTDLAVHKKKAQKMSKLNPSEQIIQMYDSCAVVSVTMDIAGLFNKLDISGLYQYLRVWSKIENKWKVVAGCVSKVVSGT